MENNVRNRVSKIQELLPAPSWRLKPTRENPADCASRGMMGNEIENEILWWNGCSLLAQDEDKWPHRAFSCLKGCPEEKKKNL